MARAGGSARSSSHQSHPFPTVVSRVGIGRPHPSGLPAPGGGGEPVPAGAVEERSGVRAMWDTVQTNSVHLSHDMPCPQCGHAPHTYLACGDTCDCEPVRAGRLAEVARA